MPHSGVRSPPTRHRGDREIDQPDLHAPCRWHGAPRGRAERRQCALRPDEYGSRSVAYGEPTPGTEPITGGCSVPAAVPAWRTELPDLVEVVAVSRQWRRSSRPSAVRSWVAPRSPARTRREVLSQVLGQRPKLTASPGGQADPGAAYYRVIRTRVPSGIPDSRCNAAAGTRTQPLLTAWPNTDRSGQPCRPTVPGPPPKVESASE
jgi:hypothetical protein